jgi:hypothetical protein
VELNNIKMKKIIILLALCMGATLSETANAQVTLSVNIATQPIWGPVGYDHVEYYYLPEIDSYYYVPEHKYVYLEGGSWISRSNLPQRYSHFDMYNSRKVVINDKKPYMRNQEYRSRYGSSHERSNQISIRDSHDSKYFVNKNHPEHSKWKENKGNQHNQGKGNQEKGNQGKGNQDKGRRNN